MAEQKNALTEVSFHGAKLIALRGDTPESTMVAMKPIAEGMGLAWEVQLRKIKAHPVLSKGMTMMVIPSAGGPQETMALPLTRLNFWLALVQTRRVPDADTREQIVTYQAEAADALFQHFFGQAIAKVAGPTKGELARMIAAITEDKLADHLLPFHAGMAELTQKLDDLAANRVTNPSATPARDYITVLAYLESRGWPAKGRRAAVNAISARLTRHSERHGFAIRRTAEKGTRMFHVDAWATWEGGGGIAYLSALRDQREGQGRLNIERGRRRGGAR